MDNNVMKFNPNDNSFVERELNVNNGSSRQYNDLVEHSDGYLYCLPFNARKVLKVNMTTLDLMTVGDDLGDGEWEWMSSVIGKDNCIYGIPCDATRVVRFDPSNNTSTMSEEE